MSSSLKLLLTVLVALFVVIGGVWGWSVWYQSTRFVRPGKLVAEEPQKPVTLPPLRATDPARGSADPQAVTIVEFADYHCAYCRLLETELQTVFKESKRPVKLVWRDVPIISDRPEAIVAPVAARCAAEQGRFWSVHDALLGADDLSYPAILDLAQKAGVEIQSFDACIQSGRHLAALRDDRKIAESHGMTSAPTIFVGGKLYVGLVSAKQLLDAIERAPKIQP